MSACWVFSVYEFLAQHYAPPIASLVDHDRARPLDQGDDRLAIPPALSDLSVSTAFDGNSIVDHDMAACCLSGLWLLYDQLDRSHDFSQKIKTPTGSFWHGIMHRREGDYSNAKYWFRNVGDHPVYEQLAEAARQLATKRQDPQSATELVKTFATPDWDPFTLVDACESAVRNGEPNHPLLVAIQRAEWELLFGFCYGRAVG